MASPEKRRPGQTNEQYQGKPDPRADFIGTQSLSGGGDAAWVLRGFRALMAWRDRRKGSGS